MNHYTFTDYINISFLPCDAMQAQTMPSCSVCPSVCHIREFRQNE